MLSSITIQIQALTRRKEKLQNSLHESPQSLLPDPNYTVRFESGCFTRLLTHPRSFSAFFLKGKFSTLGDKKRKSSVIHTKDFCGKNMPKLLDFE
jgi:hypothetical protein